jgi:non-ribosomal peptide synthase protein (TIGR01720 family)
LNDMNSWLDAANVPVQYLPLTSAQVYAMNEMQKLKRPGWYTIELALKTKTPTDLPAMKESVYRLVDKYEILRVRIFGKQGQWVQEVYPLSGSEPFASYDVSDEDEASKTQTMKRICMSERDGFVAEKGNLIKVIFFKFSETEGRIWFCLHHVISDFGSVFIWLKEFMATYDQLIQGKELKWEASLEYRKWLYLADGYLRDVLFPAEVDYWLSRPWNKVALLPSDFPDVFHAGNGIAEAVREVKRTGAFRTNAYRIGREETGKLFGKFGADMENLLMAVLFLAVAKQRKVDCLHMKACNSGRYILPAEYGVNVYKILGCLAITKVLVLEDPCSGNLLTDIHDVLGQVKAIPGGGIGFYQVEKQIREEMDKSGTFGHTQKAEIYFNYLGRVDSHLDGERYEVALEDTGLDLNDKPIHGNLLDVTSGIEDGGLFFTIFYCADYLKQASIEEIMSNIRTMIDLI